jgi:hypothetical protein
MKCLVRIAKGAVGNLGIHETIIMQFILGRLVQPFEENIQVFTPHLMVFPLLALLEIRSKAGVGGQSINNQV